MINCTDFQIAAARGLLQPIRSPGPPELSLDNFDLDRSAMAILHDPLPVHIKVATAFTRQISEREDLRFIVEAMLQSLEIPHFAQGVKDRGAVPVLAELGLAAYQAYAGGRPERFPPA